MKESQKQIIVNKLKQDGEISRNWALSNYISRLSAIILVLKHKGWRFKIEHRDGDYIYEVENKDSIPTEVATAKEILDDWKRQQVKVTPNDSQQKLI